jgi:hypothetical protein
MRLEPYDAVVRSSVQGAMQDSLMMTLPLCTNGLLPTCFLAVCGQPWQPSPHCMRQAQAHSRSRQAPDSRRNLATNAHGGARGLGGGASAPREGIPAPATKQHPSIVRAFSLE